MSDCGEKMEKTRSIFLALVQQLAEFDAVLSLKVAVWMGRCASKGNEGCFAPLEQGVDTVPQRGCKLRMLVTPLGWRVSHLL
jgi:hypothetical protein